MGPAGAQRCTRNDDLAVGRRFRGSLPCTTLTSVHEAANLGDQPDAVDRACTLEAVGVVAAVDPTYPAEESLSAASIEGVDMKDVCEGRLTPGKHPTKLAGVFFNVVENLFKNRP